MFILPFAICLYASVQFAEATTITLREDSLRSNVDGVEFTGIPFDVAPGLVGLCDIPGCGATGVGVSDSIHFFVHSGPTTLFTFCSDKEPLRAGDHGDICSPVTSLFDVALTESPTENVFEATPYNPTLGQPGYGVDATGAPLQYILISDTGGQSGVPEPAVGVLAGFAGVGIVLAMHRKRIALVARCFRALCG
jgi:hypothetical protein